MTFIKQPRNSLFALLILILVALWFNNRTTELAIDQNLSSVDEVSIANEPNLSKNQQPSNTKLITAEEVAVNSNEKVQLLNQILASGNDNDSRLDTDLKSLNESDRKDLRNYYKTIKLENRNARGTTVFLLGRNLKTKEDLNFLVEVLSEPPCFSMTDCNFAEAAVVTENDEHDGTQAVTLVYPQLVALMGIESAATKTPGFAKKFQPEIKNIIAAAQENPSPKVRKMAGQVLKNIEKKN